MPCPVVPVINQFNMLAFGFLLRLYSGMYRKEKGVVTEYSSITWKTALLPESCRHGIQIILLMTMALGFDGKKPKILPISRIFIQK